MFVSIMPCRGGSPLIWAASLMIERRILVGPERFQVNRRGVARHGHELVPGDEPPAPPKRYQFPDTVAVPGDGKRLSVLHGIHDLPRLDPQVALRDLRLSAHPASVAPCAIKCYMLRRPLATRTVRRRAAHPAVPASGQQAACPGSPGRRHHQLPLPFPAGVWHISAVGVKPYLVIPVHPIGSGDHHIVDALPVILKIDKLTFIQAVE